MSRGEMVQIHMLTSYPATLLNRDDTGLAKRVPFGGAVRTRISSQCLKKHWREAPGVSDLGDLADRSTRVYAVRVAEPLIQEHGATEEEATAIAQYLMGFVDTKPSAKNPLESGQLLVLTRAETEFLAEQAVRVLQEGRSEGIDLTKAKALKDLGVIKRTDRATLRALPASIDTAMFGRMVTSDYFARVDAAVSVAHAFTTHSEAAETDYFTAVDTLKTEEDDAGAGLIQDTELTTGVFYIYAVVDMNQLRANLAEQADSAELLARNLVRVMATCSPGAKRGSTAPYAYAEFAMTERGDDQPRTLANAFRTPIEGNGADLMGRSVQALLDHRSRLLEMYDGTYETSVDPVMATVHEAEGHGVVKVSFRELLDRTFGAEV